MKRYRERCEVLETSYRETAEDYLRVAPIRSGDSVIIMNEVVLKQYIYCDLENKKGGTADSKVIDNQTLSVRSEERL